MQKLSISNEEQQGTGVGVVVATSGILSYQRAYRLTRAPLQTPAPTSRVIFQISAVLNKETYIFF